MTEVLLGLMLNTDRYVIWFPSHKVSNIGWGIAGFNHAWTLWMTMSNEFVGMPRLQGLIPTSETVYIWSENSFFRHVFAFGLGREHNC